jgi:Tfp pilus assembly protein PilO
MMSFDLKDTKNQMIVLGALVFVLGAYFWFSLVFSPNTKMIEVRVVEHERILRDLSAVEMKAKSFDALKLEYESLYRQYLKISSLLPDERQLEGFLLQLHQTAVTTDIQVTGITPKVPVATGFYMTNAFQMEVSGSYHSLGRFFARVANFPFIANVRNVQMDAVPLTGSDAVDQSGRPRTLTATFEIDTYFASEANAIQPLNL